RAESGQFEISQRPELKTGANNNPVLSDGRDPDQYYDTDAFTIGPRGFFGNVGRNTLIGPGILSFDFGLTKNFRLHEEASLQFKAEFFNIFNRVNFGLPGTNVFISSAGAPSPDPSAGQIVNTTTTSRQIQFALKIVF
ncbi:MAG: carboxypeptidase regulatory-like domain-containing protein, partial [Acidobacteria bacterium]|nr:carboxypeptidase regulatory-like domain-containing protein [Acidobacteriota bacterium]